MLYKGHVDKYQKSCKQMHCQRGPEYIHLSLLSHSLSQCAWQSYSDNGKRKNVHLIQVQNYNCKVDPDNYAILEIVIKYMLTKMT